MSGRTLLSRVSEAGDDLLPRLLVAFAIILGLALAFTILVESNLTRDTLRSQAEQLTGRDLDAVREAITRDIDALQSEVRAADEQIPEASSLADTLTELSRRRDFTIVQSHNRSGTRHAIIIGPQLAPLPDALFGAGADAFAPRVVPTVDGDHALVAIEHLGAPPADTVIAFGYQFDDVYARRLREASGGHNVALLVDDTIVASSFPEEVTLAELGIDPAAGTSETMIGDRSVWVRWETLTRGDGWARPASVVMFAEEPFAALDRQLTVNRVWALGILTAVAVLLAWLVSRWLTRPLTELTATASVIAAGDLDTSFDQTGRGEVATLAAALEQMRTGLKRELRINADQARQLRDAAARLVGAQDSARRRVAGELHDGVQRHLVMLRLHLTLALDRIASDPEGTAEVLGELADEVEDIIALVRGTSQDLFPAILYDRGLHGALQSLARRSQGTVRVTATPTPFPRFAPEDEANAYFLASEAVTNAIKHADAGDIRVDVAWSDGLLSLEVVDDGGGFDPAGVLGDPSGLVRLRDRAEAVGGVVHVDSDDDGTVVLAHLPMPAVSRGGIDRVVRRTGPRREPASRRG